MAAPELTAKAIDTMVAMNAAIRNIRLYPPGSAMVRSSVDRVLPPMNAVLDKSSSLTIAESEKMLLIFDEPLSEKELKKPQTAAFLDLLLDFGIRDLTFRKGVTSDELLALFAILSQKPEDVSAQGGLQKLVAEASIPHIIVDHKVYVAVEKDQVVTTRDQLGDGGGGAGLGGLTLDMEDGDRILAELRSDPERLATVIRAGLTRGGDAAADLPGGQAPSSLADMLGSVSADTGSDEKQAIAANVAAALSGLDEQQLVRLLASEMNSELGEDVIDRLATRLDDETFGRVAARLKIVPVDVDDDSAGAEDGERPPVNRAYERLMQSEKGRQMKATVDQLAVVEKQTQTAHVKDGLNSLMAGDTAALSDDAVTRAIPKAVQQLFLKQKQAAADVLIDQLGDGLASTDADVRAGAAGALAQTAAVLAREGQGPPVDAICTELARWIDNEQSAMTESEKLDARISRLIHVLIDQGAFRPAGRLLEPLHQVLSGTVDKPPAVRAIWQKVIDDIADDRTLGVLMNNSHQADGQPRKSVVDTLTCLCPPAAEYMLERLRDGDDPAERNRILQIFPELGTPGVAVLEKQIEDTGDEGHLRHLLVLLGKAGTAGQVDLLEPLLAHADITIQREALNSLYQIGGTRRGDILIDFLATAPDELKAGVAAMIGGLKHNDAVRPLMELIGPRASIAAKYKDIVQVKVCQALGAIGSDEAAPILKKIAQQKGVLLKAYSAEVQKAAAKALKQIDKAKTEAETAAPPVSEPAPPPDAARAEAAGTDAREPRVDELAARGDADAAVKLLVELITEAAGRKDFTKADALREKIFEIDEMALSDIVKTAEIIEQAKSEAIDPDHIATWSGLYDSLTEEEVSALFHAMTEETYDSSRPLFVQGKINDRLTFISSGEVKIVFEKDDSEQLLTTLGAGKIAGIDSFFNITVSTTSAVPTGPVRAHVLRRSRVVEWKDKQPALESKLQDYCLKQRKEHELIRQKGVERRAHPRAPLSGKLLVQMVNPAGAALGKPFKGDLSDISRGGLCFLIRTAKKEAARTLLGRKLQMTFGLPTPKGAAKVMQAGTVISANYLLNNEYAIHVRFDATVKPGLAKAIEAFVTRHAGS